MTPRVRLASGVRWSGPVIAGVVASTVVAIVALAGIARWVGALFTPAADPAAGKAFERLLAKHDEALLASRERFDGRSAFFMPTPPAPPPPKTPPKPPEDVKPPAPPPPPPPPSTYTGPKVIACIGSSILFVDGMRLDLGEERNGVKVVATNPPWTVTLHHLGKDYEVSTLPDSNEKFLNGSLADFGTSTPVGMEVAGDGKSNAAGKPAPAGAPAAGGAPAAEVRVPDGTTPPGEGAAAPAKAGEAQAGAAAAQPAGAADGSASGGSSDTGHPAQEIPPPLTKDQVERMDRETASQALLAVSRARMNRNLDDATRRRLNQEYAWLRARVTTAKH